MSAWSEQAISHVGCRLIVASSANTSLPRLPAAEGDIARALATNAAISAEADGFMSGNGASPPDGVLRRAEGLAGNFGGAGSRDIETRKRLKDTMWRKPPMIQYMNCSTLATTQSPRKSGRGGLAMPDRA